MRECDRVEFLIGGSDSVASDWFVREEDHPGVGVDPDSGLGGGGSEFERFPGGEEVAVVLILVVE